MYIHLYDYPKNCLLTPFMSLEANLSLCLLNSMQLVLTWRCMKFGGKNDTIPIWVISLQSSSKRMSKFNVYSFYMNV